MTPGQLCREVNTPEGAKWVHEACLAGEQPRPKLRSLDGDQVEVIPRARRKKPPRPEELPKLYAEGTLSPAREQDGGSREQKAPERERSAAGRQLDLGAPFRGGPLSTIT